jgi:hypothetical protein
VSLVLGFKQGYQYFYREVTGQEIDPNFNTIEIIREIVMRNRKPTTRDPASVLHKNYWSNLWTEACNRARALKDPRLSLLERYVKEPEKILRKMSILSLTDIEREFSDENK